jgi:hypothetical protein
VTRCGPLKLVLISADTPPTCDFMREHVQEGCYRGVTVMLHWNKSGVCKSHLSMRKTDSCVVHKRIQCDVLRLQHCGCLSDRVTVMVLQSTDCGATVIEQENADHGIVLRVTVLVEECILLDKRHCQRHRFAR